MPILSGGGCPGVGGEADAVAVVDSDVLGSVSVECWSAASSCGCGMVDYDKQDALSLVLPYLRRDMG